MKRRKNLIRSKKPVQLLSVHFPCFRYKRVNNIKYIKCFTGMQSEKVNINRLRKFYLV